jgi:hypothetical protein
MKTRMIVFIIFCVAEGIGLIVKGILMWDNDKYDSYAEVILVLIEKLTDRVIFSCIVYLFFM